MKGKILYFSEVNLNFHSGIKSKIDLHKAALSKIFISEVDILYLSDGGYTFSSKYYKSAISRNYQLFLYFHLLKIILIGNYKLVYLRNPTIGFSFIFFPFFLFLSLFYKVKLIIELPTYPFIYEYKFSKRLPLLFFSFLNLNLNALLGNLNFVCSNNKVPWLYKYQKINNYIDPKNSLLRDNHLNIENELNILGISNLNFWHGYEKLIGLIINYVGTYNINFYIFSFSNTYSLQLKEYLKAKNVKNIFLILDSNDEQINHYLSISHVFVDSLARSSSSKFSNFSLKSRYYCAIGVPFISSNNDPIFNNVDFVFKFDDNSTINELINWYKSITFSPGEIRNFSSKSLDIFNHWKEILNDYSIN